MKKLILATLPLLMTLTAQAQIPKLICNVTVFNSEDKGFLSQEIKKSENVPNWANPWMQLFTTKNGLQIEAIFAGDNANSPSITIMASDKKTTLMAGSKSHATLEVRESAQQVDVDCTVKNMTPEQAATDDGEQ